MSLTCDYLPVATFAGANVDSQANFNGSGYQQDGFQVGVAQPNQINKVVRQSSMIASAVANFISNQLSINVLDDGNLSNLITNLTNAIIAASIGGGRAIVTVPYSATPIFDASQGNNFEIVLTGNVTSSTLVNVSPGQKLRFVIKQDATGGRTFNPPTGVQMAAINPAASSVNIQNFFVDSGSNVYIDGPMVGQ